MGLVRLVEGVINIFLEPVTCISYFTLEEEKLQNMYYVPQQKQGSNCLIAFSKWVARWFVTSVRTYSGEHADVGP